MHSKTNNKKNDWRIPFFWSFLYGIAARVYVLYLKLFCGLSLDTSATKGFQGPALVLANHQSFMDFGIAARAFLPLRLHFVASSHFFHHPIYSKLFRWFRLISKKQFAPDVASVRKMVRITKDGGSVCIFPEGQISYTGINAEVDPGIGELAKLLNVPVLCLHIRGNHLYRPKWACGLLYPSKAQAWTQLLLTQDEVDNLPVETITQRILDALEYNEFDWQRKTMAKAKHSRTTVGLEHYLWFCPSCQQETFFHPEGNHLSCPHCGYHVTLDDYGFFHLPDGSSASPDNTGDWMKLQQQYLRRQIQSGQFLPFVSHGKYYESALGEFEENGYRCYGEGIGTLSKDGFTFEGTRDGQLYTYRVTPHQMWNVTHSEYLHAISLTANCVGDRDYAYAPTEPCAMIKIVQAWPILRDEADNIPNS